MKYYQDMTWEEKLSFYDTHNRDARFSNDLNLRLFGVCGCQFCAQTRKQWADNPAPINDQRRKGSTSMSSINVCDRDGALVTGAALGQITIRTSADPKASEVLHYELCPHCIGLFVAMMEADASPAQQRPFIEPWRRAEPEDTTVQDIIRMVVKEVNDVQKQIEAPTIADGGPGRHVRTDSQTRDGRTPLDVATERRAREGW